MVGKIFLLVILIALLAGTAYLVYNLYLDNPPTIEEFKATPINTSQPSYDSELQFYPDMRFNKLAVSYLIGEECDQKKKQNMLSSFAFLEEKTKLIFYEADNGADINIHCEKQYIKGDLFVAGEGGPSSFVNTGKYNVILKGDVLLLYDESCENNVEMHELLHVFGFGHSNNPQSVMYNISRCNQVVTDDIIDKINQLYSQPALPDLYFAKTSALKRGRYMDIDFTVRNQGLLKADEIKVSISSEEEIEIFELGEIDFGAGKTFSVTNLKLPSRNLKKIVLLIKSKDRESDEENNKLELTLA